MAKSLKANCFDIVNFNGKAVLFRTGDVALNKFTFTIINLTGEPLSLTGGEPDINIRSKLPAVSNASTFSIDFEAMLTEETAAGLQLILPDRWVKAFSPGTSSTLPSWLLTPESNLTIGVVESVIFKIENIRCSETRPGNFEIMYRNIPDYRDSVFPVPKHLDVLNPPNPEKKTLPPLKDGYINPVHPIAGQQVFDETETGDAEILAATGAVPVYITYDARALIENGFTYILTNTSKSPLVQTPGVQDAEAPVPYISFVFGDEDYAITTQRLGDNNITIAVDAKLAWEPSAHIGGTAYWQFSPQSSQVMEGLETVYFPIKKIITPLDISGDMADKISIMYVQLNNIPGYNDATFTVQMQKKTAEATMEKSDADRYIINYGQNVQFSWVSVLARRVIISYETRYKELIVLDSDKGEIKLNGTDFLLPVAPSEEYNVIRASAYGSGDQTNTKDITITLNQVQASITSFAASPQLIGMGVSTEVVLSWDTLNAQHLKLVTPEERENVGNINLKNMNIFRTFGAEEPASSTLGTTAILGQMNFAFIDMGQGDCTLISCPDNSVYIVDCGTTAWSDIKYFDDAKKIVRAWAGGNAVNLIITHPDKDHYNQYLSLLTSAPGVKVNVIYFSKAKSNSSPLGNYRVSGLNINMKVLGYPLITEVTLNSTKHIKKSWSKIADFYGEPFEYDIPAMGLVVASGQTPKKKDWSLTIIAGNVPAGGSAASATATNAVSLCTVARLDTDKLFLTGDATEATLTYLYNNQRGHFKNCAIFQVPHHGSDSSTPTTNFKNWVNPQSLLVSVGLLNDSFNLPKKSVLDIWLTCTNLRTVDEWTYDEWERDVNGYYSISDLTDILKGKWAKFKVLTNNSRTFFWLSDPKNADVKNGTGFYGFTNNFYFIYRRTKKKDLYLTGVNGSWYDQDFFDPANKLPINI